MLRALFLVCVPLGKSFFISFFLPSFFFLCFFQKERKKKRRRCTLSVSPKAAYAAVCRGSSLTLTPRMRGRNGGANTTLMRLAGGPFSAYGGAYLDGGAPRTVGGAGAAFLILCAAECPAAERANRARRRDDDAAGESLRSKGATIGSDAGSATSSIRGSGDWLATVGRTRCRGVSHGRHSPPRVG